jgi:hypothetical protein
MKKLYTMLAVFALLVVGATFVKAQPGDVVRSATFTFNSNSAITSWNGSDLANPPYPYEMGSVSLQTAFGGSYGSAIDVPWQLGFLNNGFLNPCDSIVWEAKKWVTGDGTHAGDTFTVSGSTTCPYFTGEYGPDSPSANLLDGFSVTALYVVRQQRTCSRYRCYTYFVNVLQGGAGIVEETTIN